ncbi:hypothetical protein HK096_000213, partial [Nowakowskiella sp. JEL0078]
MSGTYIYCGKLGYLATTCPKLQGQERVQNNANSGNHESTIPKPPTKPKAVVNAIDFSDLTEYTDINDKDDT